MKFCINKETEEVHNLQAKKSCLPTTNRVDLGEFSSGVVAVNYAKIIGYRNADGCKICNKEAHTK